jgi:acyl-CoA synthetase (NDP forming)
VRRQANFISVNDVDELLDVALTVQNLADLTEPRAAVVGGGGGTSVLAADACDRSGIPVPWLSEETQRALAEHTPVAGTSVRNPIDSNIGWDGQGFEESLSTISADSNIDWVLLHFGLDSGGSRGDKDQVRSFEEKMRDNILKARQSLSKPLAVVMRPPGSVQSMEAGLRMQQNLGSNGVAVYSSVQACAAAVRKYLDWRDLRD